MDVGEKALQRVPSREWGAHLCLFPQPRVRACRRAALLRRHLRFRTARGFGCPHLTCHRATSCRRVRAAAFKRPSWGLVPKPQTSKEQPSARESHPRTGMDTAGIGELGQTLCPQQSWFISKWGLGQRRDPLPPVWLPLLFLCVPFSPEGFLFFLSPGNSSLVVLLCRQQQAANALHTLKQFLSQAMLWNESERLRCCQCRGAGFPQAAGVWICLNATDLSRRWLNVRLGFGAKWGKAKERWSPNEGGFGG